MHLLAHETPSTISHQLSCFFQENADIRIATTKQNISIHSPVLSGVLKEIPISDGVHLSFSDTLIHKPLSVQSLVETTDEIDIGFTFSGCVSGKLSGFRQEFGTFDRLSTFTFFSGDMNINMSIPEKQHFKMIKLRFTRKSFEDYCEYAGCVLPKDIARKIAHTENSVTQCSCFLPEEAYGIAANIVYEVTNGDYQSYYLQGLCVDFTRIMVEHLYKGFSRIHPKQFVSYRDIDRVREAYDILSHNIVDPPKLIELAHKVGLNDYKLKTGFRQAYGMSVHETLTDLRLNYAARLLKEEALSVTECALRTGYGKSSDLSAAFKRKFGVSPAGMKKMKTAL